MGIFTRFRDIVNSNINAMLDAAEDPEKMIRLMIQEMEETLIEMKSTCAGSLATRARVTRTLGEAKERVERWENNAKLAITRGSEELAREALLEKRRHTELVQTLERELAASDELTKAHQEQISQLEKKLVQAREKQRLLVQRHVQATQKVWAQTQIRHVDTGDAFQRFDQFEARIERVEAMAGLIRPPEAAKQDLEQHFAAIERDQELDKELQRIKAEVQTH